MATIRKLSSGNKSWQALIRRKGHKALSKTFYTKKDASRWAQQKELEISHSYYVDYSTSDNYLFLDALTEYEKQLNKVRKPSKQFLSHLKIIKSYTGFKNIVLSKVSPSLINEFKLYRFASGVCSATVKKDLSILSRVFNFIESEKHIYLPHGNPVARVSLPKDKNISARNRRLEEGELESLLASLKDNESVKNFVLFAIETGMRRGEILNIQPSHINFDSSTLLIPETKTGTPRKIPLSNKAKEILKLNPRFELRADSVTQAFSRACKRAGLKDLRLHDLRHEATSRFFEKGFNTMQVALITGHRDIRMLQRYTHLRAEDLAKLL